MKKLAHESFPELLQTGSGPLLSYPHRKRLKSSGRQKSENLLQKYNDRMPPSNSLGGRVLIKSAIAECRKRRCEFCGDAQGSLPPPSPPAEKAIGR
jgi:hypothetical protein